MSDHLTHSCCLFCGWGVCVCNQMCTSSLGGREASVSGLSSTLEEKCNYLQPVSPCCQLQVSSADGLGSLWTFSKCFYVVPLSPQTSFKVVIKPSGFTHRYFSISSDFPRWKHWTDRAVSGTHTHTQIPFGLWVSVAVSSRNYWDTQRITKQGLSCLSACDANFGEQSNGNGPINLSSWPQQYWDLSEVFSKTSTMFLSQQ